jgi:hypothetical protein
MRTILSIGCILLLVAAWLGHETPGSTYAQEGPRLASLEIDIWPEFDRPAVLVILHAQIAEDVTLPASVSLRIPSSSGGPAALAYATSEDGQLLNLPYERTDAQADFITLTFSPPERFFQVEFYDPLRTDNAGKNYSYVWPGDLAVDQVSVEVQQPAGATELSVQPELGAAVVRPDGLSYREAGLGASNVGDTLTIDVRYQKTDPRTSTEILGLVTPAPPSAAGGTGAEGGVPRWLLLLPLLAALAIGASFVVFWRRRGSLPSASARGVTRAGRRRERATGQRENAAGFCTRCGNRLRSGDRFCPECGTVVGTS